MEGGQDAHAEFVGAVDPLVFEDLAIHRSTRQVWHDEKLLSLTKLEYDLLLALIYSCGEICTREDLMRRVWGYEWLGDPHVVETLIGRLRAKLGESGRNPGHIHTVRGVGYRFQAHPQQDADPIEAAEPEDVRTLTVELRVTVSATGDVTDVTADIVDEETRGSELPKFT